MRGIVLQTERSAQEFKHDSYVIGKMDHLQSKHKETYRHCVRVALLGEKLASALNMDPLSKAKLVRGCFIHDVGKIMISNQILDSNKPLSAEEWDLIKQHPRFGADILLETLELEEEVIELVLHHHERWDGKGYPHGLKGEEIPLLARVCSVVDAFDSMLAERPYRRRKTVEEAMCELERNMGTQFDPLIVQRFIPLLNEVSIMYIFR
ncbi:HD-GYP domain-containing protein [Cohnella abietis]|uniref:HD-GYP domain-containing protein n=1 Tax=Cohnella abietis TaxID=2507935 RepID=A0A3T1DCD5_9BACL|nr:HD domain-containing phosphohydrolase [Cohnella abietis]BBI35757.1 hypothetical protein KCTCHS21_51560 [Cohnella abietis]